MKSSSLLAAVMLAATAWFTSLSAQEPVEPAATNAPPPEAVPATAAPAPVEKKSEAPAAPAEKAAAPGKASYIPPSADGKIPGDLKGLIEKIDATAGTLVVDGKTIKLNPKGKVYVDNERKGLADLKEGDRVAVTFREGSDGTLNASRIIKGTRRHHRAKKAEAVETEPAKPE